MSRAAGDSRRLAIARLPSRPVDLETAVDGSGNGLQVIWV